MKTPMFLRAAWHNVFKFHSRLIIQEMNRADKQKSLAPDTKVSYLLTQAAENSQLAQGSGGSQRQ